MALRKRKKVTRFAAFLGQVSGEKRFQRMNAHIGIQQHKNPVATYNKTRVTCISFNELLPPQLVL